jgi:hypothetical protein
MIVTTEIASITILSQHQNGTETVNRIIPFKVFKQQQYFKAIPLITAAERKQSGLSAEISFRFIENRIVPAVETNEANLDAMNKIASELRMLRIF